MAFIIGDELQGASDLRYSFSISFLMGDTVGAVEPYVGVGHLAAPAENKTDQYYDTK
jgi:hypothetical protein